MRIAICDDQEAQCLLLTQQIARLAKNLNLPAQIQTFKSADAFLFAYETDKNYDLLLLDIQMPRLSGMDLARRLRRQKDDLTIALITASERYALEGYEVDAIAYLLKPVSDQALSALLTKAALRKPAERILVRLRDETVKVSLSQILYLESAAHDTLFKLADGTQLICPQGLSHFEADLALLYPGRFFRIHRCYLLYLPAVTAIHRKEVILTNGEALPIARGRFSLLNQAYLAYYHG